jgi:hypothetical protein
LDGREFELDTNTRRTRQDQDTRVDFLKLRIDKTKTERLTLVKIRDQGITHASYHVGALIALFSLDPRANTQSFNTVTVTGII